VLYSFGREDQLDRDAIRRLIASLQRALEPDEALAMAAAPGLRVSVAAARVLLKPRPVSSLGGAATDEARTRLLANQVSLVV
jgi:hypothetical protein